MFRVIRNTIREVRRRAHLCPSTFKGKKVCCVNRATNQLWKVSTRLLSQRRVGVGKSTHGRTSAGAIKGIPINQGLINWSKRLRVMVRVRRLVGEIDVFEQSAH